MDKPMYLPTKEEFLKYVNEDYHVISTAEKNLRNYLKGKYGKELETAAQAAGTTAEVYLEAFIAKLRDLGTDVGKGGAEPDPQAQIQSHNGNGMMSAWISSQDYLRPDGAMMQSGS